MAKPTRAQIEGWIVQPKYKVELYGPVYYFTSGWVTVNDDYVSSVSGSSQSGTDTNGLSFGSNVGVSFTVKFTLDAEIYFLGSLTQIPIRNGKIRVSYGFADSDFIRAAEGVVTNVSWDEQSITVQCAGYETLIKDTKLYTDVYHNRPVATQTTIASQEDPQGVSYAAGIINEIFFKCGGRPIEQYGMNGWNDDTVLFWYSCTPSLFNPEWVWLNGDNLYEDLLSLVRSVGGQIYQANDGVMHYIQPLLLGDNTSVYTYDTDDFQSASVQRTSEELAHTITCTYTPRRLEPIQEIYNDTTPRMIEAGGTIDLELETELPIYEYTNFTASEIFKAINFSGDPVTPIISLYTRSSQKVSMTVMNTSSSLMVIHSIILKGRPISARDEATVKYTFPSATEAQPEKLLEKNVYIQNEAHARKIAQMTLAFYGEIRPILQLKGVAYDTDRYIGETITVNYPYMYIYNQPCRIINISHDLTGISMDIDLVPLDVGIPTSSKMFKVGTTYTSGTVKQLSY